MGFYVKALNFKSRQWKAQHVEFLPGNKRKFKDLNEREALQFGFNPELSTKEAKLRASQLNLQSRVLDNSGRIARILSRVRNDNDALNSVLGALDVEQFEKEELHKTGYQKDREMHWRKAKKIMVELKIPFERFNKDCYQFYKRFQDEGLSYSYCQKIIWVLNKWGQFQADKYTKYFRELPYPNSRARFDIEEAYLEKNLSTKESQPLIITELKNFKGKIREDWFNWLFIACAFGLRPSEVDALKKPQSPRTWAIDKLKTVDGKSVTGLMVSQGKIIKAIGRDRAIKAIPIITPEQEQALQIIKHQLFNRPSHVRHFKVHFGERRTLYAPRKGFALWMRELKQDQVEYSRWLGHTSVIRTEASYEQRHVVNFKPIERPKNETRKRA